MSFRNTTITITGTCDSSVGEEDGDLDAFIAGLKIGGMIFGSKSFDQEGPEAVMAPSLNPGESNAVTVTIANFTPEEGASYYLDFSDNNGETWTTYSDNVGPNDEYPHTYNSTRIWRVVVHKEENVTPGPSAGPIP